MIRKPPLPWCTLALAAAALAVAAAPGAFDLLVLDREAVARGEAWRLFTGHLVHATPYHLTWDVIPLLLLGLRFERMPGSRFPLVIAGSAVFVSLGVLLLDPAVGRYCGLSGILNGMWVAGALAFARQQRRKGRTAVGWLYRGAVVAGLAKIGVEGILGLSIFTDTARLGADPVPLAHALGALAGAVFTFRAFEAIIPSKEGACTSRGGSRCSQTSMGIFGRWRECFTTWSTAASATWSTSATPSTARSIRREQPTS